MLAMGASCSDFLDVKPVGNVSEADFANVEGVDQLVTGMYAKMHDDSYFEATLSNYAYGDVMGGSANKGSTYQDQPDFTSLETFTFTTLGWGHGVGMSQAGAIYMAKNGADYREILAYFYPGAELG